MRGSIEHVLFSSGHPFFGQLTKPPTPTPQGSADSGLYTPPLPLTCIYPHTNTTFFKKLAKREKNCQFVSWSESFYNFKKIENRSNSIYIAAPIITPHTVGRFTSLVDRNLERVTIILISLVIVTLTTKQPNQKLSSKILSLTGKTDACSRKSCHPPVLN